MPELVSLDTSNALLVKSSTFLQSGFFTLEDNHAVLEETPGVISGNGPVLIASTKMPAATETMLISSHAMIKAGKVPPGRRREFLVADSAVLERNASGLEISRKALVADSSNIGTQSDVLDRNASTAKTGMNTAALATHSALLDADSRLLKSDAAVLHGDHDLPMAIAAKLDIAA